MKLFSSVLMVCACFSALNAQILSVGVKGGIPATDVVQGSSTVNSEARPYTVGPMVQVKLPFSFALEVDALYKRIGYSAFSTGTASAVRVRANSWEFPIFLKYYLPGYKLPVRPYAGVGYVLRHLSGMQASFASGSSVLGQRFGFRDDLIHGAAVGAGIDIRAGRLSLGPEIRYTHWAEQPFRDFVSRTSLVRSTDNQFEFLIGVRF
jgi:hypothetical protein